MKRCNNYDETNRLVIVITQQQQQKQHQQSCSRNWVTTDKNEEEAQKNGIKRHYKRLFIKHLTDSIMCFWILNRLYSYVTFHHVSRSCSRSLASKLIFASSKSEHNKFCRQHFSSVTISARNYNLEYQKWIYLQSN